MIFFGQIDKESKSDFIIFFFGGGGGGGVLEGEWGGGGKVELTKNPNLNFFWGVGVGGEDFF